MGDFQIFGIPISIGTMIYQAIVFTILVFLLKKYVFKKLVNVLESRRQHIENQLQLTEKYKLEANKVLESQNDLLVKAKSDAREIMRNSDVEARLIIKDAKDEAKRILNEAREDASRIRSHALDSGNKHRGA